MPHRLIIPSLISVDHPWSNDSNSIQGPKFVQKLTVLHHESYRKSTLNEFPHLKPQIDRRVDSEYDNLPNIGSKVPISAQISAAIAAHPGAIPTAYELPTHESDASRVLLQSEGVSTRVFVHPVKLEVLGSRPDDGGFIRQVRSFHGQLGMGERGSNIVELAASWTMIMILTGLYLWWPRSAKGLAGVPYPSLRKGSKLFWRDIHSVTGIWISIFLIFLLATGERSETARYAPRAKIKPPSKLSRF